MLIQADTHCHTVASTHAYSTVMENAVSAAQAGLKAIAITDHTTTGPDAPHIWHFHNLKVLPRKIAGVTVLKGAEVNIIGHNGELDEPQEELERLEWVIASAHSVCISSKSIEENTNAYIGAAKNPLVDVIGHCTPEWFPFDYEKGLKAFKEYNKLVEINESSIVYKKGSRKNAVEVLKLCKKLEVPVIVNTDAHFCTLVGAVPEAEKMIEELDFPKKLIINSDWEMLKEYIINRRGNIF